jgi:hypothetical protein
MQFIQKDRPGIVLAKYGGVIDVKLAAIFYVFIVILSTIAGMPYG